MEHHFRGALPQVQQDGPQGLFVHGFPGHDAPEMNCYTYFGHVRGVVKYKVYFPFSSLV
jgi:hypothetical protein